MTHSKVTLLKAKYPTIKEIRKSIVDDIITELAKNKVQVRLDNLELYLIIDEAITNAMEHGNKWNENKYVHIEVAKDTNQLYITITDEGTGFKHPDVHSKVHLQPRGRGIFIIKQFAKVSWNKKGNSITMAIPILHTDNSIA
ncbi:MAG: ATP-binding protein [Spirochaetota bacterium]|nr:ATP-binding protein [Spirochaetota bacterium]